MQDLEKVRAYYSGQRDVGGRNVNIYQIWEDGGAYNDSVTPSTFSGEYRSHIVLKLLSLTAKSDRILSLGCGNGFVEAELNRHERSVIGIDCVDEAVRLTKAKGVNAVLRDFFDLQPADVQDLALVYADGFLGHIFSADTGLLRFFQKLRSLNLRPGCRLVFSNDAPRTSDLVQKHDTLEDFWFLSKEYLSAALGASALIHLESYSFPYFRPISGLRNRTICVAYVP